MTKVCQCCKTHAQGAKTTNPVVQCTVCHEQCQCDGCVAEAEYGQAHD